DRQVSTVDKLGNQHFVERDPTGRIIRTSLFGATSGSQGRMQAPTLDQPLSIGQFASPLLAQAELFYDEMGRRFQANTRLFAYPDVTYRRAPLLSDGPSGQASDGIVTALYERDRAGRLRFVVDDSRNTTVVLYDAVFRPTSLVDPEGNELLYDYDDN